MNKGGTPERERKTSSTEKMLKGIFD